MHSSATDLLQDAIRLHRQGAIDEAARAYARVLAADPDNSDARYYLAVIAYQQGDLEKAAGLAGDAIGRSPTDARPHRLLGQILQRLGRSEQALASFEQAVACAPEMAEAHGGRADTLVELRRTAEAVEAYDRALALKPDSLGDWCNRGAALDDLGRHAEAIASYDRAIALQPDFAEAHFNRASALMSLARHEEALAGYDRALALRPDYPEARANRSAVLQNLQRHQETQTSQQQAPGLQSESPDALLEAALSCLARGDNFQASRLLARVLTLQPALAAKVAFLDSIKSLSAIEIAGVEPIVMQAMAEAWVRPDDLAPLVSALLQMHPPVKRLLDKIGNAPPAAAPLSSAADVERIADDALLSVFLQSAPVCDAAMEQMLTGLRRAVLDTATTTSTPVADPVLAFMCALAQQCFVNEYVFAASEPELRQVQGLRQRLEQRAGTPAPIPAHWIAAIAAYVPLYSLPCAPPLLARNWPEPLQNVLRQQIEEPAAELQIRASIPALTPIAAGVSQLVRDQYEEMPYPRWTKPESAVKPLTFDEYMRSEFPKSAFQGLATGRLDVLIAGCGTGRQPIEFALKHPGCDMLAVDLSLASLSYAKRKARELGLDGISFAQADIVLLPTLDRTFDLIDCVGVLHHLADPMAGWHGLVPMMRPGGVMGLGFYSALARRDVLAARDFIAARGYRATADDIRRCRQDMMQEANPAIRRLLFSPDFYTTSECRDLIFHVQEHQLTLPAIKAFLSEHNLAFLGFRIDPRMREQYRRRFPSDVTMIDLDNWHRFETENPGLFGGMYIFWVQKPKA